MSSGSAVSCCQASVTHVLFSCRHTRSRFHPPAIAALRDDLPVAVKPAFHQRVSNTLGDLIEFQKFVVEILSRLDPLRHCLSEFLIQHCSVNGFKMVHPSPVSPPTSPEPDHNSNSMRPKRARETLHQIAGTFLSGDGFWCDSYCLF